MTKIKGTPLTVEFLRDEILPSIERVLDKKFSEVDSRFNAIDNKFKEVDRRFNEIDNRVKEVLGELSKVQIQYKRTNWRVDRIDKHLGINTVMDE